MSLEKLKGQLTADGTIDWHSIAEGVVCNYSDGADYVVLRSAPQNPTDWIHNFKLVNTRRTNFIHAFRWCIHDLGGRLAIEETGVAHRDQGESKTELPFGEWLTELLTEQTEAQAFSKFDETHYVGIAPSHFNSALKRGAFEPNTPRKEPLERVDYGIDVDAFMVAWTARDLRVAGCDELSDPPTKEDADRLVRENPEIMLVRELETRFRERVEISGPLLRIRIGGEKYYTIAIADAIKRVRANGISAVQAEIIEVCQSELATRSSLRNRFFSHLAKLGYAKEKTWDGEHAFGRTHVLFSCDVESLLDRDNPLDAICSWLRARKLPDELYEGDEIEIEERNLPVCAPSPIPRLEEYDVAELNGAATAIIRKHESHGFDAPHEYWANPMWNVDPADSWATEDWWREQARRKQDRRLLWQLGDHVALHEIIAEATRMPSDWDAGFAVYEGCHPMEIMKALPFVWPNDNPLDVYLGDGNGSAVFVHWTSYFECVPYELKRYAAACIRAVIQNSENVGVDSIETQLRVFRPADIGDFLSSTEIESIRDFSLKRAQGPWRDGESPVELLTIAAWFDWTDVADQLEENLTFWESFRTWPVPAAIAGEVALAFSRFDRPELTRRIAAWALSLDSPPYRKDSRKRDLLTCFGHDRKKQRLAAAIAWSRSIQQLHVE